MAKPYRYTRVLFKKLYQDVQLPEFKSGGAAGMDIRAHLDGAVSIPTGDIAIIPTGFSMAMEENVEAQIRPRSGLAIKHGVTVVNSPGTIDSDYRGEVKVGLINLGKEPFVIAHGDRVAQMVINVLPRVQVEEVDDLDETERGEGGFGSTGSR